jgi:hypothetical protein
MLDKSVDQPYQSMCRRLLFRSDKDESRTLKGQTVYLFNGSTIHSDTVTVPKCVICGESHDTRLCKKQMMTQQNAHLKKDCKEEKTKCPNCIKEGRKDVNHQATGRGCPVYKRRLEIKVGRTARD